MHRTKGPSPKIHDTDIIRHSHEQSARYLRPGGHCGPGSHVPSVRSEYVQRRELRLRGALLLRIGPVCRRLRGDPCCVEQHQHVHGLLRHVIVLQHALQLRGLLGVALRERQPLLDSYALHVHQRLVRVGLRDHLWVLAAAAHVLWLLRRDLVCQDMRAMHGLPVPGQRLPLQ